MWVREALERRDASANPTEAKLVHCCVRTASTLHVHCVRCRHNET